MVNLYCSSLIMRARKLFSGLCPQPSLEIMSWNKTEKCNLLCLSQRNDLIRICELIPMEMGHVSPVTRKKSKIKIIPVEIVTYKDCTMWGLAKWSQWVEHLLGWVLAPVSHLSISLAACSWLAPLQNSFLQKKKWCSFFSLILQRRSTSGRRNGEKGPGCQGKVSNCGEQLLFPALQQPLTVP